MMILTKKLSKINITLSPFSANTVDNLAVAAEVKTMMYLITARDRSEIAR